MSLRPHAPTPPVLLTAGLWNSEEDRQDGGQISPSSAYVVESPSTTRQSPATIAPSGSHNLSREVSEDESFMSDFDQPHSARSPKLPSLPDPSQYPDPYPYKPRHWQHGISTPTLSSADSSSASTRSSAYTNSARSGDYGHVHVALGGDDLHANSMGISTDDVAQLLARETGLSSSSQNRAAIPDQQRWSYAQSMRSRSSSVGNRAEPPQDTASPALRGTTSFDQSWEPVEEKDEIGLTSGEETDDDAFLAEEDMEDDGEEEATSAMMVAEEGRGVIVRADSVPIVQLQVNAGESPRKAFYLQIAWQLIENVAPAPYLCRRYYTPLNWIFEHAERRTCIPDQCNSTHRDDAALPRYLGELSSGSPSGPSSLHVSRGIKHCIQSPSCTSSVSCRSDLAACAYRRLDWDQHAASSPQCIGQIARIKRTPKQDELPSELVMSSAEPGDIAG